MSTRISRRSILRGAALGGAAALTSGFVGAKRPLTTIDAPFLRNTSLAKKVIVIGMDGMDPNLIRRFVAEGELPTFKRFLESSTFGELGTTLPPQSPVAWSSFITGTNPGGHGIFDFVHRDPKAFIPYMSTSRSFDSKESIKIGDWSIPLSAGKVDLMRKGPAFWSVLEDNGIPASLFQIPANFPITSVHTKAMSGMGTPDLLGTYGTFTLISEKPVPGSADFTGGRVVPITLTEHKGEVDLPGPKNSFKVSNSASSVKVAVTRDPWSPAVKVTIDGQDVVLKQGEFSEWIPLTFEMVPLFVSVHGMVRLYIQQVHPDLRIYVSPINVDPMEPTLPICSPAGYSRELSQAVGRFYTQGFPADTKALSTGVFSDDEFLAQAKLVLDENLKNFDYQFSRFSEGFFFFYFSSTDQNSHMLWRCMDPTHPQYNPNASPAVKNGLKYFYKKMDEVLKQTLSKVDNSTTLLVLSDHGFSKFEREFHLSTWLVQQGYTVLTDPSKMGQGEFYRYVDWQKTTAYALGINALFINLKGREKRGSVEPNDVERFKLELITKLEKVVDPKTGKRAILRAYDGNKVYSGAHMALAPDIVLGYASGYRVSDEAVLGKFPTDIFGDRTDKWAADHCVDPSVVPGMMLSNRGWKAQSPGIWDLAPTILNEFGLTVPGEMTGKPIFES